MERALRPFNDLKRNKPLDESEHTRNVENMILDRQWERVAHELETTNATLIGEFYTKVIEHKEKNCFLFE